MTNKSGTFEVQASFPDGQFLSGLAQVEITSINPFQIFLNEPINGCTSAIISPLNAHYVLLRPIKKSEDR